MLNLDTIMLFALAISLTGFGVCCGADMIARDYRDLKVQQKLYKSYLARN